MSYKRVIYFLATLVGAATFGAATATFGTAAATLRTLCLRENFKFLKNFGSTPFIDGYLLLTGLKIPFLWFLLA